jgi:hypothetical protein
MADFRDNGGSTECEPSENEVGFAGHLLSTELDRLQRHFTEPQLKRSQYYNGPLAKVPEEEVRALLAEMLEYFQIEGYGALPFPPRGLPGTRVKPDFDDPARRVIGFGWDYFTAAARNKTRAMHNAWREAADYSLHIREKIVNDMAARDFERRITASETTPPQLVYFIGSQAGPIKIGAARDPGHRCKALQTSHHEQLSILATRDGGQEQERKYHHRFAKRRLQGEWFERCPEILAEIERLNA